MSIAVVETRQTIANLTQVLKSDGSGIGLMLKVCVQLRTPEDWAEMNAVYCELVPEPRPARTTTVVSDMAAGARIEIDCIAAVDQR